MAIPTCTVTASSVAALLGDSGDDIPDASFLAGMTLTFVSNVPPGSFIPIDDSLYLVGIVEGQVDVDGVLKRIDPVTGDLGDPGVVLLADDPALNLDQPLQWQVRADRVTVGEKTVRPRTWIFDAPADGVVIPLAQLVPVAAVSATVLRGPRGYGLTGNFLGQPSDEADMLALSGDVGDWAVRQDTSTVWVIIDDDHSTLAGWMELQYPAMVETINTAVVAALADNALVVAAAEAAAGPAVDDYITGLDLIQGDDARIPQATSGDPYAFVEVDETGFVSRYVTPEGSTWLKLHEDVVLDGAAVENADDMYLYAVIDEEGRVSELSVDHTGRFPQWVCDSIVTRGVPPTPAPPSYTLKVDGSGDYDTLADAIAALGAGTVEEPIEIVVYPGTHDAYQAELPDWFNLRGINKLTCVVHGFNDDDATDSEISNNSTLQVTATNRLSNLTITCRNMRYAVHDESGGVTTDGTITVNNCHIEHYGNQDARDWRTANPGSGMSASTVWATEVPWGYGTSSGNIRYFVDTTLVGGLMPWNVHDNSNFTRPSEHDLENCTFGSADALSYMRFSSLGAGQWSRTSMRGCSAGVLAVWYDDLPYIGTADDLQIAQHVQHDVHIDGLDPVGFVTANRGKALKIESAATTAPSTVRVSGTGADAIFGQATHRDGGGGLQGYVYGQWDISGILCGILSNTTTKNTLGRRLGDCSSVNKTLTVTVDGGAPINIVFNTDLTATSNATIISTINTALGSAATASEYLVTSGESYPDFTSRIQVMPNRSGSVGIPRWNAVKLSTTRGVELMETTDAAELFYGVSLEPIAPGKLGRILTSGRLHTATVDILTSYPSTDGSQMAGLNTVVSAGTTIYHDDANDGLFATSGTRIAGVANHAGWVTFTGQSR